MPGAGYYRRGTGRPRWFAGTPGPGWEPVGDDAARPEDALDGMTKGQLLDLLDEADPEHGLSERDTKRDEILAALRLARG